MRLDQEAFDRIVEELRTQDNQITSHPLYQVLERCDDGGRRMVKVHLTRSAAMEYIEAERYYLKDPAVYISSQESCPEWNALRIALMEGRLKLVEEGDVTVGSDGVQVFIKEAL